MKGFALSVRQPWASLIIWGLKTVEIRTWSTKYRGPLFIHAAKRADDAGMRRFYLDEPPCGCLIGMVDLVGVDKVTPTAWKELAGSHLQIEPFVRGLYAWHLENARPLPVPIPYRGDRGLFDIVTDCIALQPHALPPG